MKSTEPQISREHGEALQIIVSSEVTLDAIAWVLDLQLAEEQRAMERAIETANLHGATLAAGRKQAYGDLLPLINRAVEAHRKAQKRKD